jgi:predicted AAA+ superfamily ATPase
MERSLTTPIKELAFSDHKIALVSGPRQCGKTTLGKMLLAERKVGGYHNWDDVSFRRMWTKEPTSMTAEFTASSVVPLLVLDEIHKVRGWKRTLKGLYDTRERPFDLIVTGSARLNVYKKGGDTRV